MLIKECTYTHNLASTLNSLALFYKTIRTKQHNTDLASFQIHAHALNARGEPDKVNLNLFLNPKRHTRQALRLGHYSCHGHGQYHHYWRGISNAHSSCAWMLTQLKGHDQSRRDQLPPEHHESSALG